MFKFTLLVANLALIGFTDAAQGDRLDGSSTGGYVCDDGSVQTVRALKPTRTRRMNYFFERFF